MSQLLRTPSEAGSARALGSLRRPLPALAVTLALWVAAPTAEAASRGFFGIVPQGRLQHGDFQRMGKLGLSLRLPVFWSEVEPRRGELDFSELDRVFGEAADNGVGVLPVLSGTPSWLAASSASPPLGPEALSSWTTFLGEIVGRYGAGGSFWETRVRRAPVHLWQIWNEPNFPIFWAPRPAPRAYARLLHRSARTIRAIDPDAGIVAAGLAPIERQIAPWEFLRRLYRARAAKRDFDFVALHPYASTIRGLAYEVRMTRQVMARAGDARTPLLITEFGVASGSQVATSFDLGPVGQARFLEAAYNRMLERRRRWRIAGAYWYAWADSSGIESHCVFCQYSGLFDRAGRPKPAWWAMRRVVTRAARQPVR